MHKTGSVATAATAATATATAAQWGQVVTTNKLRCYHKAFVCMGVNNEIPNSYLKTINNTFFWPLTSYLMNKHCPVAAPSGIMLTNTSYTCDVICPRAGAISGGKTTDRLHGNRRNFTSVLCNRLWNR